MLLGELFLNWQLQNHHFVSILLCLNVARREYRCACNYYWFQFQFYFVWMLLGEVYITLLSLCFFAFQFYFVWMLLGERFAVFLFSIQQRFNSTLSECCSERSTNWLPKNWKQKFQFYFVWMLLGELSESVFRSNCLPFQFYFVWMLLGEQKGCECIEKSIRFQFYFVWMLLGEFNFFIIVSLSY